MGEVRSRACGESKRDRTDGKEIREQEERGLEYSKKFCIVVCDWTALLSSHANFSKCYSTWQDTSIGFAVELQGNIAYWICWFVLMEVLAMQQNAEPSLWEDIFISYRRRPGQAHMAKQSSGHQFKGKKEQMGYKYHKAKDSSYSPSHGGSGSESSHGRW